MMMTADDILRMTPRDARNRFASAEEMATLLKTWHPDVCSSVGSNDVFRHLVYLRKRLRDTTTGKRPTRRIETADGRVLGITPLSTVSVDQGEVIINRNTVATIFPPAFEQLATREVEALTNFCFADSQMERQMAVSLPRFLRADLLADGSTMVIVEKGQQEVLLSDLLRIEGRMPEVHAAWLCSALMNITTWLSYVRIMHGAISPAHILVDPAGHSVRLATGWAFACSIGTRPSALPGRTLRIAPELSRRGQLAETRFDRDLVRQCMRDALGDPHGTNGGVSSLPAPLAAWINLPPCDDALTDYAQWQWALESGWGKRRFVEYDLRARDIYPDA